MYKKIMVPVDLTHRERLDRALSVAGELAKLWHSEVVYVGVTTEQPSSLGHTPEEYRGKLEAFAAEMHQTHGCNATGHAMVAHDPTVDIDDVLLRATKETGADLVVMASHDPGIVDWIWPSNGGKLAAHAHQSVMLVRG